MPYCEILSSPFLHMGLANSVCTSKPPVLNSIHSITMHWLINSKDDNFLGITVSIELGISPIPTIIKN